MIRRLRAARNAIGCGVVLWVGHAWLGWAALAAGAVFCVGAGAVLLISARGLR